MATRSERVKLGMFLTVATVLLGVSLVLLTGAEIWTQKKTFKIRFEQSVSGLEPGAPVKQMGVRIGVVDHIRVAPGNVEVVEVWIRVQPDAPIKTDTLAYVNMQGITGLKFIELRGGSKAAGLLEPRSEIKAGTSTLRELSGRATEISLKFEQLLNNFLTMTGEENREQFNTLLERSNATVGELNRAAGSIRKLADTSEAFLDDNRKSLKDTIESIDRTSQQVNRTLENVDGVLTALESAIRGADVPMTVTELRETNSLVQSRIRELELKDAIRHVTAALKTFRVLLDRVSQTIAQNQDSFRVTMSNLRTVSENLKQLSRTFQEKPYIRIFGGDPAERSLPEN